RPSRAAAVWRVIEAAAEAATAHVRGWAQAGSGVLRCVLSLKDDEASGEAAASDGVDRMRRLVQQLRLDLGPLAATVTVERCPPAIKRGVDVWGVAGPDVELMRRVKAQFDPNGVLSPGRGPGGI